MKGCPYLVQDGGDEWECTAFTTLTCDHCMYGVGKENPFAKENQEK